MAQHHRTGCAAQAETGRTGAECTVGLVHANAQVGDGLGLPIHRGGGGGGDDLECARELRQTGQLHGTLLDGDFLTGQRVVKTHVALRGGQAGLDRLIDRAAQGVDLHHGIGLQADLAVKTGQPGLTRCIKCEPRCSGRHTDLAWCAARNDQAHFSLLNLQARCAVADQNRGARDAYMQVVVWFTDRLEELHLQGG